MLVPRLLEKVGRNRQHDVKCLVRRIGAPAKPMSAFELRREKIKILRLCTAFAYAVKHRLRGEYDLDYADYENVLPKSIINLEQSGAVDSASPTVKKRKGYNATGTNQPGKKDSDDEESEHEHEARVSGLPAERHHGGLHFGSHGLTLDRTDPETPLLGGDHHTVQFHPATTILKTPLPLM